MRRRLFTILSALSLLMCVAVVVLWVRGRWVADTVLWCRPDRADGRCASARYVCAYSGPSGVVLSYESLHRRKATAPLFPPRSVEHFQKPVRAGHQDLLQNDQQVARSAMPIVGVRWGWGDYLTGGVHRRRRIVAFPYGLVLLLAGPLAVVWLTGLAHRLRASRRGSRGLCHSCGYDLRATPGRCPECGQFPSQTAVPGPVL